MRTSPNQIPTTPAIPAALLGAGIGNFSNENTEPTAMPVVKLRKIAFIVRYSGLYVVLHRATIDGVLQHSILSPDW